MRSGSSPKTPSAWLTQPARPNTANRPSTATITGRMKGAPRSVIRAERPTNRRRASARATGTASATLTPADSAACTRVKRTACQSAGPSPAPGSARQKTAPSAPRISTATRPAAPIPGPPLTGSARSAIRSAPGRAPAPPLPA